MPMTIQDSKNPVPLRKGAHLKCPHCGRESVVVVQGQFDGWKKVGEVFVCGLCEKPLGPVNDGNQSTAASEQEGEGEAQRARALLGLGEEAANAQQSSPANLLDLDLQESSAHFCRDCRHYLIHPFISRCLLHDTPVEPMGDCSEFQERAQAGDPKSS